ncbi:MAG: motility-associated protein [Pseudomonadota bacterium]
MRNGCLDMVQIIGLILILLLITGGLALSGGPAILSALPFELTLILGAGIATVLIGNSTSTAVAAFNGFAQVFRGTKWTAKDHSDLLITLHEFIRRAKTGGLIAIENDIEHPETSALFRTNPALLADQQATALICDGFRLLAMDPAAKSRLRPQLEEQVAAIVEERQRASSALHTLADALPALGIVAAVLGIIKTMGFIDSEPMILGEMIAAALLGTFLGVFLSYGVIGPIASRLTQITHQEALYLDLIQAVISGHAEGLAPRTNIELARNLLPLSLRPTLADIDTGINEIRFKVRKAA